MCTEHRNIFKSNTNNQDNDWSKTLQSGFRQRIYDGVLLDARASVRLNMRVGVHIGSAPPSEGSQLSKAFTSICQVADNDGWESFNFSSPFKTCWNRHDCCNTGHIVTITPWYATSNTHDCCNTGHIVTITPLYATSNTHDCCNTGHIVTITPWYATSNTHDCCNTGHIVTITPRYATSNTHDCCNTGHIVTITPWYAT